MSYRKDSITEYGSVCLYISVFNTALEWQGWGVLSEEGRVGVLYNTALAVSFNKPQSIHRDITVLHVQHLQVKTVGGYNLQALPSDALTRFQAQALQVEAVEG